MLTINYTATLKSDLHTGSDEKGGTFASLRKSKVLINNPKIKSRFKSVSERRRGLMTILLSVYREIDRSLKMKYYGYYEAFGNNLLSATSAKTKWQWLNNMLKSCGVKSLKNYNELLPIFNQFQDIEFLELIRNEKEMLSMLLRLNLDNKKEAFKEYEGIKKELAQTEKEINGLDENAQNYTEKLNELNAYARLQALKLQNIQIKDIEVFASDDETLEIQKSFEYVPFVSGNQIGGIMRDLLIDDYYKRLGITKDSKKGIDFVKYHEMKTGGNITSSTDFEDIEKREQYIELCPPIGLLGSAIGSMTIESAVSVSDLQPVCKENGTGERSVWELVNRRFGTRLDDGKRERQVNVIGENKKAKTAQQMIYEKEVLNEGTKLNGSFSLMFDGDELMKSCLWHGLYLLKEYGCLGGGSNRGLGRVEYDFSIPENANKLYLEHLQNVKKQALETIAVDRLVAI